MQVEDKSELLKHLNNITGHSQLAMSVKMFCFSFQEKSDNDIQKLLEQIKLDIKTNFNPSATDYGTSIEYFKNYQLPTDHAPVAAEGLE